MKSLKDELSLDGQTEEITMTELRSQPGDVFTRVSLGKKFVVTKGGVPVAVISKPELGFDWNALQSLRSESA